MTTDQALDRVRKCLALARGSTEPHEAAAALRQAQVLMLKYGLAASDAEVAARLATPAGRAETPAGYLALLIRLVEDAFGVKCIYIPPRQWCGETWLGARDGVMELMPSAERRERVRAFIARHRSTQRAQGRDAGAAARYRDVEHGIREGRKTKLRRPIGVTERPALAPPEAGR